MKLKTLKESIKGLRAEIATLHESAGKEEIERVIAHFKKNPDFWRGTVNQFYNMAQGHEEGEVRGEYYPNWTNDDFKYLLLAMGEDPDDVSIL